VSGLHALQAPSLLVLVVVLPIWWLSSKVRP
jgi:hypothetical protein